jgi:UDP-galactopyranose mutase
MLNVVVGTGFSGSVIAHLIANCTGQKVLIIDRRNHIAGNSYDYADENRILIHKYGSHIFHTDNEKVWSFLERFGDFNQYIHRSVSVIDGIEATVPFNLDTLYEVFPRTLAGKLEKKLLDTFTYGENVPITELQKYGDKDLKFLGKFIYDKVFYGYCLKHYGVLPEKLDKKIIARLPVCISRDDRYFRDKYQGIPIEGYTKLIEKMLNHPNIEVRLNTDFNDLPEELRTNSRIFYTGSIDEFFGYKFGQLPYLSINFKFETHAKEFYQSHSVVNYPNDYDFYRVHEYKHYNNEINECSTRNDAATVIAKEYAELFKPDKNERYYPMENEENGVLYRKYLDEVEQHKDVYFLGRLGDYKYYDMDDAVSRAMELFEAVFKD